MLCRVTLRTLCLLACVLQATGLFTRQGSVWKIIECSYVHPDLMAFTGNHASTYISDTTNQQGHVWRPSYYLNLYQGNVLSGIVVFLVQNIGNSNQLAFYGRFVPSHSTKTQMSISAPPCTSSQDGKFLEVCPNSAYNYEPPAPYLELTSSGVTVDGGPLTPWSSNHVFGFGYMYELYGYITPENKWHIQALDVMRGGTYYLTSQALAQRPSGNILLMMGGASRWNKRAGGEWSHLFLSDAEFTPPGLWWQNPTNTGNSNSRTSGWEWAENGWSVGRCPACTVLPKSGSDSSGSFVCKQEEIYAPCTATGGWQGDDLAYCPPPPPTCQACHFGFYKSTSGSTACTACPQDSTTLHMQAESQVDCLCNAGSTGVPGGPCQACEAGKYKDAIGTSECVSCGVDTYSDAKQAQCTQCPAHSHTQGTHDGITSCVCDAGYQREGDVCNPCPTGTHKPSVGNTMCEACAPDTYQDLTSQTSCKACRSESSSVSGSTSQSSCLCNAGYLLSVNTCEQCGAGTYKSSPSNSNTCTNCPSATYSDTIGASSVDACTSCQADSNSPSASVSQQACLCNAGFEKTGTLCVQCEADYFCTGSDSKQACPINSTSTLGSSSVTNCICKSKTYREGDVCIDCPGNHYCNQQQKTACPENSFSKVRSDSENDCVCSHGFMPSE